MKFLFIESYPHVIFGQQRTLLTLLEEASTRGHECVVGVTSEGMYVEELRRHEYDVLMLPYPEKLSSYGGAIYRYKGMEKLQCYGQGLKYLWSLRKMLKREMPDIIFCNDMRGLLTVGIAAKVVGIPVVIWDKLDKPHGWLDHLQLPLVTKNVVISHAVCKKYPAYQKKWLSSKIVKVSEGVFLKEGQNIRGVLPGSVDDIYVAIVGSISERKGHDRLIGVWSDLLKRVPRLRLLVIGDASDEKGEEYKEGLFGSSIDRVHLLGMRDDVDALMESIDILVVPSRHEGLGMVIIEAMIAGKAVIGARAGGIPEVIVDGETGILIDGHDPQQMINAVVRLANDRELGLKMGAAGRERAQKHFNRPAQMAKVVDLLESVAK